MIGRKPALLLGLVAVAVAVLTGQARAQTPPTFSFENFAGTYYLDRDGDGVAKLTTQEDMVVQFSPTAGLYGLKRALPTKYRGRSVDLKIISLTDAAGDPVPYRASSDKQGNRVISTGDPDITLAGPQTYRLNYQTSGVAAFYPDRDEFLVNVNGRGWEVPFNSVKAFIRLRSSFSGELKAAPVCYIGDQKQARSDCTIKTEKQADGTLVTAATTQPLSAHQALVIKLAFKNGTFKPQQPAADRKAIYIGLAVAAAVIGLALLKLARRTEE